MTTETIDAPVTQEEIDAIKAQVLAELTTNPQALAELMTKNAAVLTVQMPIPMSQMIEERAGEAGKANWARQVLADAVGFELKQAVKMKKTTNKHEVEARQKGNRAAIAEIIAKARAGEIDL